MKTAKFPVSPAKAGTFVPKPKIKRAAILRPADIRHVLRVIEATSRWPERDSVAVLISVCVGMRCSEIARITPRDILNTDGTVKPEVGLRAAITKGCSPRTAYFTHPKLIAAIQRYMADRVAKRIGTTGDLAFGGIYPDIPFLFSSRKGGFSLVKKVRLLESGVRESYSAADGLEATFKRIFDRSGLPDCSSHAGRRTFASTLLAKGVSSDDVSKLLGHSALDNTMPYLECSERMLEDAFRDVF